MLRFVTIALIKQIFPFLFSTPWKKEYIKRQLATLTHGQLTPPRFFPSCLHCLRQIGYCSDCDYAGVSLFISNCHGTKQKPSVFQTKIFRSLTEEIMAHRHTCSNRINVLDECVFSFVIYEENTFPSTI